MCPLCWTPHPPSSPSPCLCPCILVSSGSDNVVDVIAAHGLLPCSKCLFGRFLGRVGEVERAVPEAGHVRRRRRDIRVDPVRRAVVCGAGQRPRGPGERAGRSSGKGGGQMNETSILLLVLPVEYVTRAREGSSFLLFHSAAVVRTLQALSFN